MKKILAVAVALMLILTLTGCSKDEPEPAESDSRPVGSYNTVEEGGLRFQMPDYFGDPEMSGDVKNYYAETGDSLVDLQLSSFDGVLDEDDFESECDEIYDSYVTEMKDSGEIEDFEDGTTDYTYTYCGLYCMVYTYSFTVSDVECNTIMTMINNTEAGKVVMVSITQSEQSEYDYTDVYTEMVDTCEIIGEDQDVSETSDDSDEDSDEDSGLLSPEFKKTMDDYEAWFDHYCEVMKKYEDNPSDYELMSEAMDLLSEEAEMLEEMENLDESEMNDAELAYYLEVTARIEKKLLEVAY